VPFQAAAEKPKLAKYSFEYPLEDRNCPQELDGTEQYDSTIVNRRHRPLAAARTCPLTSKFILFLRHGRSTRVLRYLLWRLNKRQEEKIVGNIVSFEENKISPFSPGYDAD